jgi:hypothetical protein
MRLTLEDGEKVAVVLRHYTESRQRHMLQLRQVFRSPQRPEDRP